MFSLTRSIGSFAVTLACALIGFYLQNLMPEPMVTGAKGAVGSVVGLVTLLLALVLGLLISVSYGVYATQINSAQDQDVAIHQLDFALVEYGPEANEIRRWLKSQVQLARKRFFSGVDVVFTIPEMRDGSHTLDKLVSALDATAGDRRPELDSIKATGHQFMRTQLAMARQLHNPVPPILLTVMLGWSSLLFLGYGLLASFNALSAVAVALGSAAVASALFLILEFSQPFGGLVRIPAEGIDTAIAGLIPD